MIRRFSWLSKEEESQSQQDVFDGVSSPNKEPQPWIARQTTPGGQPMMKRNRRSFCFGIDDIDTEQKVEVHVYNAFEEAAKTNTDLSTPYKREESTSRLYKRDQAVSDGALYIRLQSTRVSDLAFFDLTDIDGDDETEDSKDDDQHPAASEAAKEDVAKEAAKEEILPENKPVALFSARAGEKFFWHSRPANILLFAAFFSVSLSTMLAAYWPNTNMDGVAIIGMSRHTPKLMPVWVWAYCILVWLFQDCLKVLTYHILRVTNAFGFVNDNSVGWKAHMQRNHGTMEMNRPNSTGSRNLQQPLLA